MSSSSPQLGASPLPRGNRLIGFDVNTASDGDFERAFQLALGAGMQRVAFSPTWAMLEPEPQAFDSSLLDIAAAYYPARDVKIELTLMVVNANRKEFPADLMERPFDAPVVLERFKKLLDFVFTRLPVQSLGSLNIGSELDTSFGADPQAWARYTTFYKAVSEYVHARYPGLPIATEQTFAGLTGPAGSLIASANAYSDILGVSYYPLDDQGNVRDPSVVHQDFAALASAYPGKEIYFYQLGYPSSSYVNSSEDKQSRFIAETFRAWDQHRAQVRLIIFTWLHDASAADVRATGEYYGLTDRKFTEHIASLGLRTYAGENKKAFETLIAEARAREW